MVHVQGDQSTNPTCAWLLLLLKHLLGRKRLGQQMGVICVKIKKIHVQCMKNAKRF